MTPTTQQEALRQKFDAWIADKTTHISVWKTISLGKGAWMVDVGNGDEFEGFKPERLVEFGKSVREAIDAARAALAASPTPSEGQR